MLSKQQLTFVRSLHQKKYRQMYGKFLVEGDKLVRELLTSGFKVDAIYGISSWPKAVGNKIPAFCEVTEVELAKISTHEAPNQVLAVAYMQLASVPNQHFKIANELVVVCDGLNDPGNAGTIIRTAEWFGVKNIYFSEGSVDIYNPKVVSAAKGSLFRVKCHYADLKTLFEANKNLKVYGTFMDGESIYKTELAEHGFILIGNEANGISAGLQSYVTDRISIPSFGKAESLNAAVAAGLVLGEFKRKQ